uniref:EGF-like domain-containing protein n=1 Tax=Strongyloides papillosus TaxID=174720 RepID=A0A0N5BZ66_STREA
MNKTIEYEIKTGFSERTIEVAHDLLAKETCLNFTRIYGQSTSATVIRKKDKCSASAEIHDKKIHYYINVNWSCSERDKLQRLIYWSTEMRYQITKCLAKHGRTEFLADRMIELLTTYHCIFENPRETDINISNNLLEFSGEKSPKKKDIVPSNLVQKDYSVEISFHDVRFLNEKICKDSCKSKPSKKCKNNSYPNPRRCTSTCLCPFFYSGTSCEKLVMPKDPWFCKSNPLLTATSKKRTLVLDLFTECFYKIKPSSRTKKFM